MPQMHLSQTNEFHEMVNCFSLDKHQTLPLSLETINDTEINIDSTYYMHDISDWKQSGKTIVFDSVRGIHITNKSTRTLMNQFMKRFSVGYISMQVLANHLNFNGFKPFVLGNIQYVPLTGTSRNLAHWVAVHLQKDIHPSSVFKTGTAIEFNNWQINLPIPYQPFLRRIKKTQQFVSMEYAVMEILSNTFQLTTMNDLKEISQYLNQRTSPSADLPPMAPKEFLVDVLVHFTEISHYLIFDERFPIEHSQTTQILLQRFNEAGKI